MEFPVRCRWGKEDDKGVDRKEAFIEYIRVNKGVGGGREPVPLPRQPACQRWDAGYRSWNDIRAGTYRQKRVARGRV